MSARILCKALTKDQLSNVDKLLYFQPVEEYKPWQNRYTAEAKAGWRFYDIDTDQNTIALPLTFARCLTGCKNLNWNIDHIPIKINFKGELRQKQVGFCQEALSHLRDKQTTTLNLYTGCGKTVIGAYLACQLGLLVCVLLPRTIFIKQWLNTFETVTDAVCWVVGEKNPPNGVNVILCMEERYSKIDPEIRRRIGTLIIDEAHMFATISHVNCLLSFEPRYVIQETATWYRDDQMMTMMEAIGGDHKVSSLLPVKFDIIAFRTGFIPNPKTTKKGKFNVPDYHDYTRQILYNGDRNETIMRLIDFYKDEKIMVMTPEVEHVKEIHKMVNEKGYVTDWMANTKGDFQDCQVLVGTMSKMGTGFDESSFKRAGIDLDDEGGDNPMSKFKGKKFKVLMLSMSFKSKNMMMQCIGRVMRDDNPVIIFLVDEHRISEKHWSECKNKIFKHLNCDIYEGR